MGGALFFGVTVAVFAVIGVVWKTFVVVPMREHVIKERLGKYSETLQPGFHFMVPFIDRAAYRQEMREQVINVPAQTCITRDNIQVEVDGFVYLKVVDAYKASYGIGDYVQASVNLAQTTMRSEIGKLTLDDTFSERDRINENIVREIDKASEPWGVKMIRYEIMNITPSRRVIDTMEKQMEAERDKRAAVTISTGQREAQILLSEGHREAAINHSEGERQRRMNEATGRAEEIRVLAEASAEGLRLIADATAKPGGSAAVKVQLLEQFIEEYGRVLEGANVSVVPHDLARIKGVFEGLGEVTHTLADDGKGVRR
jgi:regulator of protease activity HflC (stomatin/prohibitin superfamily)